MSNSLDPSISDSDLIAIYRATLRFKVEHGTVWINPGMGLEELNDLLLPPPNYANVPWPPALSGVPTVDVSILSLSHLIAGLSLGTEPRFQATSYELSQHLKSKYPGLDPMDREPDLEEFMPYLVQVDLTKLRVHRWSVRGSDKRRKIATLFSAVVNNNQRSPFDIYVQTLLRLDLALRLEELRLWQQSGTY